MTEATDFRDDVTTLITENGGTVVIIPRTPVKGTYGGYDPVDPGEGTSVSTLGIPSNFLTKKSGNPFGKLREGEVMIVLKYSETVEKDYKITWKSDNYTVREIKEITMQDTIIGKRVLLSRVID